MKIRSSILALVAVLASFSLTGCSESPQPVDAPAAPPPAAPGEDPARVTGTIVLEGAAFDAPTGTLYVSIHPKGERIPLYSRQYLIASAPVAKDAAGVRSMAFDVGTQHFLGSPKPTEAPPVECELAVKYKESVDVASKTLAEAVVPYQAGKRDYQLTLKLP